MTDEEKRAKNAEKSRKRRAELEEAAALNGFDNWSAMLTYIKNEAKEGRCSVNVVARNIPDRLNTFMYALMKKARNNSFIDFCEHWEIDYDTEYQEIKTWFEQFGIKL